MKELVVVSGKGGTGKTSIVASFAALAERKVLADCDVDAADLHLVLEPRIKRRNDFRGGKKATIIPKQCTSCGRCHELCRFGAVIKNGGKDNGGEADYCIDPISCEGCGVCVHFCPAAAISFEAQVSGEWFVSDTNHGPMVHAKLGIAEENSGKLVTLVRQKARQIAEAQGLDLIIVDASPGIGCPVIASITGASLVLVVTEPTLSGIHDLERVCELTRHFQIPTVVCVNKYDLNEEMATRIEAQAEALGVRAIGKVRYDPAVTKAQIMQASVVEYTGGGVSQDVKTLWRHALYALG